MDVMSIESGSRYVPALPEETRATKRVKREANDTNTHSSQSPSPTIPQPTAIISLTTTFTPPSTCLENRLTMLPPPGYFIWVNEPMPAANHTSSACFPGQFLKSYQSVLSSTVGSSVVPAMAGLVCPSGYCTKLVAEDNYAACCPSDYRLHLPESSLDPGRPGYGGTCYSDFSLSSTYLVTAYDADGQTNIQQFVATTTGQQAYAHPIDGFAASPPSVGCPSRTSSPAASPAIQKESNRGLIIGVSIGAVSALIAIVALAWYILRHIRNQKRPPAPPLKIRHIDHEKGVVEVVGSDVAEKLSALDPIFEKECTVVLEMEACALDKKGDVKDRESSLEGPFEMSADSLPAPKEEVGDKDEMRCKKI